MLQKIRDLSSGWFARVFFGLVIVTFSLWGIQGYFSGRVDTYAARSTLRPGWFGTDFGASFKDISPDDFRKQLEQERERQRADQGERFDASKFDAIANKREVLDHLIQRELLLAAATRDGLVISDAQLAKAIAAMPAFQLGGKFDKTMYTETLAGHAMSPAQFEASQREDMLVLTLPTEISLSGIYGKDQVDEYLRLVQQKRDLRYLDIPAPADAGVPGESELHAWYQKHAADYRTQEQVSLEYLEINAATIPVPDAVDEATLRQRYEEQKNRFIEPEQRLASHILINVPANADAAVEKAAQAKAAALAAQARTPGADFAKLAQANSQDEGSKNLGGDLGWLTRGVIEQKAFASALFALKPGQISDPVRTAEGWHVIELRDVRPGRQVPFESVRDQLQRDALKDQREKLYNDLSGKLVDLTLKDSTTLAPAARALGLPIQKTPLFTRDGGPGIASNPKVLLAAFSASVLEDGNTSDPIELGTNHDHMVVIRVAQHLPVKELSFKEVHDRVLADVQADRRAKAARIVADSLLARAGKGETIDAIATSLGGSVQTADAVTRDSTALAKPLIDAGFRLPHPVAGKSTQSGLAEISPDHYALVEATRVADGDPGQLDQATHDKLREQLPQMQGALEMRSYIDMLRNTYTVKIAEDRL